MVFIMTIREMYNANMNMSYDDICILHCQFDNSSWGKYTTDDINGCIVYQDVYDTMPGVLKGLKVKSFKCLSHTKSLDEHNKWDIWVV